MTTPALSQFRSKKLFDHEPPEIHEHASPFSRFSWFSLLQIILQRYKLAKFVQFVDNIPSVAPFNVIGIGEVLWDMLPAGPQLGGAPANFAWHARSLGTRARVITRIGQDGLGEKILQLFQKQGLPSNTIQVDDQAPTGTVAVTLSGDGLPTYTIHENVAWDRLAVTPAALEAITKADAICFGTLAQRSEPSRTTIQTLLAAAPKNALRLLDLNLRQDYYSRELIEQSLRLANVLKLNDAELAILAKLLNLPSSTRAQIEHLAQQYSLQWVALTRGSDGSLLYQSGRWSDCPGAPVTIADTVGAGDAFAAAMVMGLLHKLDLDLINARANEVARYVCSCAGATPPLPAKLIPWTNPSSSI
jgi:fructokinase